MSKCVKLQLKTEELLFNSVSIGRIPINRELHLTQFGLSLLCGRERVCRTWPQRDLETLRIAGDPQECPIGLQDRELFLGGSGWTAFNQLITQLIGLLLSLLPVTTKYQIRTTPDPISTCFFPHSVNPNHFK